MNGHIVVAKIQSTDSSNKIEGIYTSDERLKKIVLDEWTFFMFNYMLDTLNEAFPWIIIFWIFII